MSFLKYTLGLVILPPIAEVREKETVNTFIAEL